ncbi:MAG: fasciclin domain-containing protein [Saprospiraceae bacterium]
MLPTAATVVDVIVNSPNHNTLETAVTQAGLVGALSDDGPFTVFAPTDAAFNLLPAGELDDLLADPTGDLARILLYHVLSGEVLSSNLSNGQTATTLLGQDIAVTINADGVFINNAKVSVTDIRTFNGVVHVLDAVMLPPATTVVDVIVNSPNHNTLETAVVEAGLVGALSGDGPFTVFAPTDAAFDLLQPGQLDDLLADPTGDLAKILRYHVLGDEVLSSGLSDGQTATTLANQDITVSITADGVFIDNVKVSVTDIRTLNGVVHVIDGVLIPVLTSVKDLTKASLKVSPNPTTDFVQIEVPEEMTNERVTAQWVDTNGNILRSWTVGDRNTTSDVTEFATGTYFLILRTNTTYAINTVIVNR